MAVNLSGFDDLLSDLDNLGNIGSKVGKKAVTEGAKMVLEQQKKDAPRDSGEGADNLKVTKIKTYKSGNVWGKVGIDSSNWENSKHLYYQNYGYELWKNGERIEPHLGWMEDSLKKIEDKANKKIIEVVSAELDNILR